MHLLYTAAIVCYALLMAPRLLYGAVRHGKYVGTLRERLGRLPAGIDPGGRPSIWLHAVSVGEVQAARTLIPGLRDRYPGHRLWLSTTTQTGRAVAARIEAVDGLFYFPLDLPRAVDRVLDRVRPALFVAVDTELWPNLLRRCARRGVRTMLVNGRISDRSYPRYRLARCFFRRVLAGVDRFCAQSDESARRLVDLGAPPDRVVMTGNLKFDAVPPPRPGPSSGDGDAAVPPRPDARLGEGKPAAPPRPGPRPADGDGTAPPRPGPRWRDEDAPPSPGLPPEAGRRRRGGGPEGDGAPPRPLGFATDRPVLMAASTHPGEEEPVLDAFRGLRRGAPGLALVIAPRHPERGAEVAALAAGRGLAAARRSRPSEDGAEPADVVVLDTVGELAGLFGAATVVFLGGSLVPVGGHNVIEAAAWGRPVVFGPHMQNFAEVAKLFLANGAARQVGAATELEPALAGLLADSRGRAAMGAAARSVVEANRGAAARSLAEIAAVLPPPGPPAADDARPVARR